MKRLDELTATFHLNQLGHTVVSVRGSLDMYNVQKLRPIIRALIASSMAIVQLDLTEITRIDESGIALLMAGLRLVCRHNSQLYLAESMSRAAHNALLGHNVLREFRIGWFEPITITPQPLHTSGRLRKEE